MVKKKRQQKWHNIKVSKGHQALGLYFLPENQFGKKVGKGSKKSFETGVGSTSAPGWDLNFYSKKPI